MEQTLRALDLNCVRETQDGSIFAIAEQFKDYQTWQVRHT